MKNKDNFHEKKNDSVHLGEDKDRNKVSKNPAPKGTDRESENTPPGNEVYVDLEPDELHLADEEDEVEDVSDLRNKDKDKDKKNK
ncbi:hypothetical protein [uncultured Pontibacter sp.]|uniref:hypothetical protein n=1 Tax=uncultured Pontibacter sp. TaxID=453356 RepID=UPI00260AC720|nr:hypothetical protein [uncultured Pontibacter sp.]